MGPLAAALIVAALSTGTAVYMNKKQEEAQEAAMKAANDKTKFMQDLEAKKQLQLQNTAASGSRRRTALVKRQPTGQAGAGPSGSTQIAGNSTGLTPSNGGINPNAGNAGTF